MRDYNELHFYPRELNLQYRDIFKSLEIKQSTICGCGSTVEVFFYLRHCRVYMEWKTVWVAQYLKHMSDMTDTAAEKSCGVRENGKPRDTQVGC